VPAAAFSPQLVSPGVKYREKNLSKGAIKKIQSVSPSIFTVYDSSPHEFVTERSKGKGRDIRRGRRRGRRRSRGTTTTTTTMTTTTGRTDGTNRRVRFSLNPRAIVRGCVVVAFVRRSVGRPGWVTPGEPRAPLFALPRAPRVSSPRHRPVSPRPGPAFDDDDDEEEEEETFGRKSPRSIPREPADVERRVVERRVPIHPRFAGKTMCVARVTPGGSSPPRFYGVPERASNA